MKILVDIGHPAHVHYFKNFIYEMSKRKHKFLVVARNKEVSIELLNAFKIPFVSRGKGASGLLGKILYYPIAVYIIIKNAILFKPDFFLSFGTIYPPIVSFIFNKTMVTITDTEHEYLSKFIFKPFSDVILTPSFFREKFGKNHLKVNTLVELGSLHPEYFRPDISVKKKYLNINDNEKFIIIRFVEWNASHDLNENGLSITSKRTIVSELSKIYKVFISSEGILDDEFKKYQLKIPAEKMHDVLFYSELFFGESGTMAVESALLGTPAITFSSSAKKCGNFLDLRDKYELLFYFEDDNKALNCAKKLLGDHESKSKWKFKSKKLINETINFTKFLIWFFENYPHSKSNYKSFNN